MTNDLISSNHIFKIINIRCQWLGSTKGFSPSVIFRLRWIRYRLLYSASRKQFYAVPVKKRIRKSFNKLVGRLIYSILSSSQIFTPLCQCNIFVITLRINQYRKWWKVNNLARWNFEKYAITRVCEKRVSSSFL